MFEFEHQKQIIGKFLKSIEPLQMGYQYKPFAYLAVKREGKFELVQGRLALQTSKDTMFPLPFQSKQVVAGVIDLVELDVSVHDFIFEWIGRGTIRTPTGEVSFSQDVMAGRETVEYDPFHLWGLQRQIRLNFLKITSGNGFNLTQPELDWELRGGSRPYGSLEDLASEFHLGTISRMTLPTIEVLGYNVAGIDGTTSQLSGTEASVEVMLALGLEREKLRLTYSVHSKLPMAERNSVSGDKFNWTEGNLQRGTITLTAPEASLIDCTVVYNEVTQNHFWLTDPKKAPKSSPSSVREV